jgi:RNA polymerase sigma factor (sigma-70 family)
MKLDKLTDEELLPYLRDDTSSAEKAFRILYFRYHIRIYEYFYSKLKNRTDADDKHQDTFEKFYKSVKSGVMIENVAKYIFTIAKNLYINHETSKFLGVNKSLNYTSKTRKLVSIEEMTDIENQFYHNDLDYYENIELLNLIKWAVAQLEEKYRDPFSDRKIDELSINEIAKRYNLSYEGAKKRIDRATQKIKDILKDHINEISNS